MNLDYSSKKVASINVLNLLRSIVIKQKENMKEYLLLLKGDGMKHLSPDELQDIMMSLYRMG